MPTALINSNCPDLTLISRGKVRDVYELGRGTLLFVATDRISAFDVVMQNGIPDKGKILTQLSEFWFMRLNKICPNHFMTADLNEMPAKARKYADQLQGRTMMVRKLDILPTEIIIRGYLTGSGLKEYRRSGTVCGIHLPAHLTEASQLPHSLYTPSTKAAQGKHDENISPEQAAVLLGGYAKKVEAFGLSLYNSASKHAMSAGIILADTKFEFGVDTTGQVTLADEVLTPDSSRFWPAENWTPGVVQPSFDKQHVRNYLEGINFDKNGGGIELPQEVVDATREKYITAFRLLTKEKPRL